MAHHSIIASIKEGRQMPENIYEKAQEFYYLFPYKVEWRITPEQIQALYPSYCFDFSGYLEDELREHHITENMVEVYHWICDNAEVYSDCWNPSDAEFGPWDTKSFMEEVQEALDNVPDWTGPIADIKETGLTLLKWNFIKERHVLILTIEEQILELQLSDTIQGIGHVEIDEERILLWYWDNEVSIDLYYEIYCEECTGTAMTADDKRKFVEKMLNAYQKEKLLVVEGEERYV